MDTLYEFLNWAWERHHNPLSWYIRPLFLLPYCYFAYRRSLLGIVLTLLALATSMFWFPKPEQVDPHAAAFLEMERQYLTGDWTWAKIALTALIPIWFVALAWAFWRRSWFIGLLVFNLAALGKVVWSFYHGRESAWSIVPAAALGLIVCNGVIILVFREGRADGRATGRLPSGPGPAPTSRA